MMFVKKFKRKCSVRGCKNTENVYVISKRREMSNTIALCRDCMKEALAVTENYVEQPKVKKEDRPLFPHPELKVTLSSVADEEPELNEVIVEESNVTEENPISVAEDTVTLPKEEEKKQTIIAQKPKTTTSNSNKQNNTKRK